MACSIAFDLISAGFDDWPFALASILFGAVSAALFISDNLIGAKLFGLIFTLGAAAFFAFLALSAYGQYRSLAAHYEAGNFTIVEGRVTNFYEQGAGVRRVEFATVHNREFKMTGPANRTAGYNKRSTEGGVLTEQRFVRIWHVNGKIIRLEACA